MTTFEGGGRTSLLLPPGAENPSYATGLFHETINTFVKRLVIGLDGDLNKEAKILIELASYRVMTHTNDAQTVHTCQTRSVCKPRPPAYIQGPACIQGPASISTITSDHRPVFEARLVFKARLLFEEIRYFCTMMTWT